MTKTYESPQKTAFYQEHRNHGAVMTDFHQWHLPVHYGSVVREHLHTRAHCSVFDVSHMGQISISGEDAFTLTSYLVPSNLTQLQNGYSKYSCLLNHDGGIIDDCLITHVNSHTFMLCVNASRKDVVLAWIKQQARTFSSCEVTDDSEKWALLAIQGPQSPTILKKLIENLWTQGLVSKHIHQSLTLSFYQFTPFTIDNHPAIISRTGYTGELGYEIYLPQDQTICELVWRQLISYPEVLPAGLGARNTLRLEAGYLLYGADITEKTLPFQMKLSWLVAKEKHDFIGSQALKKWPLIKSDNMGIEMLYGFFMADHKIARPGMSVYCQPYSSEPIGEVTSASYLPSCKKPGGFALLKTTKELKNVFDTEPFITINVRGGFSRAKVVPIPFYQAKTKNPINYC
ncbi:MAG: glycine cleavage system aminomethyltransferase GcvT [Proteobacteria bacterium]|nr:glycine cleavage system aminomethyltransferase GcvT [Pseudomonadota bacterium]